jgi:hypothetical protein
MSEDELTRADRAFKRYVSTNRGVPVRVAVRRVACATADLDIELTFAAGVTYCCVEPGCHLELALRHQITRDRGSECDDAAAAAPRLAIAPPADPDRPIKLGRK